MAKDNKVSRNMEIIGAHRDELFTRSQSGGDREVYLIGAILDCGFTAIIEQLKLNSKMSSGEKEEQGDTEKN